MFYLFILLFLLVGAALTMLTIQNLLAVVDLNLFGLLTVHHLPVGLLMLGTFCLGALLIYLVAVGSAAEDRRQKQRLRARITELEEGQQKSPTPIGLPLTLPSNGASALPGTNTQPIAPMIQMPGMPPNTMKRQ